MTDHLLEISYSKDGGRNWSNWRKYDIGSTGEYWKRIRARQLGQGEQWIFKVRISGPIKRDLITAVLSDG